MPRKGKTTKNQLFAFSKTQKINFLHFRNLKKSTFCIFENSKNQFFAFSKTQKINFLHFRNLKKSTFCIFQISKNQFFAFLKSQKINFWRFPNLKKNFFAFSKPRKIIFLHFHFCLPFQHFKNQCLAFTKNISNIIQLKVSCFQSFENQDFAC